MSHPALGTLRDGLVEELESTEDRRGVGGAVSDMHHDPAAGARVDQLAAVDAGHRLREGETRDDRRPHAGATNASAVWWSSERAT